MNWVQFMVWWECRAVIVFLIVLMIVLLLES